MRVASVVAPAVALLLMVCAAGCGSSTSKFCSTLTHAKLDFRDVRNADKELAALDQVIADLSPRDRKLVTPVRDYARILYGRTDWSETRKLEFLRHFFRTDAPALDRRLRDDCDVPLDKRISPFNNPTNGGGS